jgi:hypothetical protein
VLIPVFRLIPFVFVIGLLGLAAQILFFQGNSQKSDGTYRFHSIRFLCGLATTSVILILAALTGLFTKFFLASLALIVFVAAAIKWSTNRASLRLSGYLLFCLILGFASVAAGVFSRPYQAIVNASDASVYVAFAHSIANSGAAEYKDPMLSGMTADEKELFYSKQENTYARFSGGVIVRNKTDSIVAFGFLPLFSCWLALGILFLGPSAFLYLLSFQIVVGALALYWIGKNMAGALLGIAASVALFFFLPQFYFIRLPFSEGFAQTFFLCGLFVFLTGDSKQHQLLSAILWGSIFLCRIEVMFTCVITIFAIFTLSPNHKRQWQKYATFLLTIASFLLLMLYWMLSKHIYLDVWGLRNHYLVKNLWIPFVLSLSDALRSHILPGSFIFLCISIILLLFLRWILKRTTDVRFERYLSMSLLLITVVIFLWLITSFTHLRGLRNHFVWTFVYFRHWVLALLFGGFAVHFFLRRSTVSPSFWTTLIFFVPAAVFFIARPLILPQQPVYIRRCIPVVFPLFLVLSLYNWRVISQRLLKSSFRAAAVFGIFAILLIGTFVADTMQLIRTPLFAELIPEIERIGDHLPQNALVIMPRYEAGVHLELPLQYRLKRDALTIPEEGAEALLISFLKRQIDQGRPIFLLTTKRQLSVNPLPQFQLESAFKGQMKYFMLSPSKPDVVPNRMHTEVFRYQGFRIMTPQERAEKH